MADGGDTSTGSCTPTTIMMGKHRPRCITWFWQFCRWPVSHPLPLRCPEPLSITISNLTKGTSFRITSSSNGTDCMNLNEFFMDAFGTQTFSKRNMKAGFSFISGHGCPLLQVSPNIGDGHKMAPAKASASPACRSQRSPDWRQRDERHPAPVRLLATDLDQRPVLQCRGHPFLRAGLLPKIWDRSRPQTAQVPNH